jgi:glycosyltransferase involved in cell wall biosynthesis
VRLIAGHRFGIHGMREEHFGIGIAEMVRAGCVVWVPNGGGQVEIVADARLRYDSVEDAAKKIVRVLQDPAELATVRAHLAARRDLFSTEHFVREIRAIAAGSAVQREPTPRRSSRRGEERWR